MAELKKRNYLSVVFVDSTFKTRYTNYINFNKIEDNYEQLIKFMAEEEKFHNIDFENCLEYVRVRIMNSGTYEKLEEEVHKK
jgi:surface antigen